MLRPADVGYADMIGTSHVVATRVDVWRGGKLLAERLPLLGGTWSETSDQQIQESVSLTVPVVGSDGRRWAPDGRRGQDAPIGSDGHRLRITYTIPRGEGTILSCPLGWARVEAWNRDDATTITLQALGLLKVLDSFKLLTATSPPAGATLTSEILRLVDGELPVVISPGIVDRAAPAAMSWTEDRLGAMYELATALNAELRVDGSGTLWVTERPTEFTAEFTLIEGKGGTVITAGDGGSRDGVFNIVVARGEDAGDPNRTPYYAVAQDTDPASPTNVDEFDKAVRFYSSPVLITQAATDASANTLLASSVMAASSIPVQTLPDPRLTWGARGLLRRRDGREQRTQILAVGLPLTAADGSMKLTLGVVPS